MLHVTCTGCDAIYKVSETKAGSRLKCRRCGRLISVPRTQARARPAPSRKGLPAGAIPIGGAVLLVLFLILIFGLRGSEEGRGDVAAARDTPADEPADSPGATPEIRIQEDPVRVCEAFVRAVEDFDAEAAFRYLSVPFFYRHKKEAAGERPWGDLSDSDKVGVHQEVRDWVLGTDYRQVFERGFITDREQKEVEGKRMEVLLTFDLPKADKPWKTHFLLERRGGLGWLIVDTFHEPPKDDTEETLEDLARRAGTPGVREIRRSDGRIVYEAELTSQPHLESTPPDLRSRIDELAATVKDISKMRQAAVARQQLVDIGKPAIPALLNLFIGLDLEKEDHVFIANHAALALREITGEYFGFEPRSLGENMMGATTRNLQLSAMRQWFAWWLKNKDTFTGAPRDEGLDGREGGGD